MENDKLFELMEKMYADLKGSQEKMYADLKGSQDRMYAEIQEIKKDVKNNTNKIDSVEKTVLRIEQNHGSKLEALFDGYKQNSEQLVRIEKEVSKHEEVILRRVK